MVLHVVRTCTCTWWALGCSGEEKKLKDAVRDLEFHPSGKSRLLAVVLDNGWAELWDWEKAELVCRAHNARSRSCMGSLHGACPWVFT